ncbi:hypothetical protein HY478_01580 [Candidatus Uhrbacteria bacterium]|nr:hypothetical protein [Candidatus Uhrbacteria bacterium]
MNPRQFLLIGGIVLALVGVLGFIGAIGPTTGESIFGSAWWFDNAENWAHLVLGVVALVLLATPASVQKPIVALLGIVGLFFAVYNLFSTSFLGANLERPADLILHLVVGVWALYAAFNKGAAIASAPGSAPM